MTQLAQVRCDRCGMEAAALEAIRWLFLGTRNGQMVGDLCEECWLKVVPQVEEIVTLVLGQTDPERLRV